MPELISINVKHVLICANHVLIFSLGLVTSLPLLVLICTCRKSTKPNLVLSGKTIIMVFFSKMHEFTIKKYSYGLELVRS